MAKITISSPHSVVAQVDHKCSEMLRNYYKTEVLQDGDGITLKATVVHRKLKQLKRKKSHAYFKACSHSGWQTSALESL